MKKNKKFTGSINGKIRFYDDFVEKHYLNESSIRGYDREKNFYVISRGLGLKNVPNLIRFDDKKKVITISRIFANKVQKCSDAYLASFVNFINKINEKSHDGGIIKATEASTNAADIHMFIEERVGRFSNEGTSRSAQNLFKLSEQYLFEVCSVKGDFGGDILSPSDNGIHNCLYGDGLFYFIDFEYSGLDTYTKLFYDFILHPANLIDISNFEKIYKTCRKEISNFEVRFDRGLIRLFSAWWIIRLLNSVSENTIEARKKIGTIKGVEVDQYIQQRLETVRYFIGIYNKCIG